MKILSYAVIVFALYHMIAERRVLFSHRTEAGEVSNSSIPALTPEISRRLEVLLPAATDSERAMADDFRRRASPLLQALEADIARQVCARKSIQTLDWPKLHRREEDAYELSLSLEHQKLFRDGGAFASRGPDQVAIDMTRWHCIVHTNALLVTERCKSSEFRALFDKFLKSAPAELSPVDVNKVLDMVTTPPDEDGYIFPAGQLITRRYPGLVNALQALTEGLKK